jgi:hypothetical protein
MCRTQRHPNIRKEPQTFKYEQKKIKRFNTVTEFPVLPLLHDDVHEVDGERIADEADHQNCEKFHFRSFFRKN